MTVDQFFRDFLRKRIQSNFFLQLLVLWKNHLNLSISKLHFFNVSDVKAALQPSLCTLLNSFSDRWTQRGCSNVNVVNILHLLLKFCHLLHWKPFKMMKSTFYFILKALFFLKIFKILSWLFVHVGKTG